MENTSAILPTSGFRQSSPAIRAAENFALSARHHDPQLRYRALNLVKRLRAHIGLSAELLEHLDYLVAHTNDAGWSAGRPIVYKDQQTQAYNLGISDRQIRNRERRLMELGFISFEDSGNHRRYAVGGDGQDHPDLAFGINLMPLLGRLEELEALAEAVEAETRAWQSAKKVYSARRRKATALIKELADCDDAVEAVSELAERLQNLPYVRPSTHLSAIHRMVLRVDEIISEAGALLEARNPQVCCELTVDTSSREEMDFLYIHYTKNLLCKKCNPHVDNSERRSLRSQDNAEADASAPTRDQTTGKRVQDRAESPPVKPNPAVSTGAEHVTPEMVYAAAGPTFRSLVEGDSSLLSVVNVIGIADQIRPEIGISPHAWADAREIMGDWSAALCLVLAEVRARNPGGYLREMTARARSGDLHLHKSFFGILTGTRTVQ